ncbi:preprotein translocase subunit SecE [bacterium]|nr:MAG: preprotein translocase subunit SecE [bacterium]
MNEQIQDQGGGRGGLWAAVALLVAGVAGYYVMSDQPAWQRWLVVVAGAALGVVTFAMSGSGRNFWQFVQDAQNERRKVFWPGREETWKTTLVVFVFASVAGLFFWLLDLFLAWATRHLTGQGG